jgi:hypothetical protein
MVVRDARRGSNSTGCEVLVLAASIVEDETTFVLGDSIPGSTTGEAVNSSTALTVDRAVSNDRLATVETVHFLYD